ncbi:MAG: hypothetical protein CMC05_01610 [Flavobacteriaceae bacterium]|nr:hypothetical protein [Flavobacteriaceae bacterium]|tara:strand:+ start:300 stop:1046 length:747 start_codon:yes stop_codon:yes gene_type:complete
MIKFFRNIRKNLIDKGKTSKYLKYAIGEIFLVVIGILIALQVSNWNQRRIERDKMFSYYKKLNVEVEEQILVVKNQIEGENDLEEKQKKTLQILASKNHDSIPALLENIGALATAWNHNLSYETFNEFLQQGLLTKVEKKKLKQLLLELKAELNFFERGDVYIDNQYNMLIEPFFAEHINYSNAALPMYREHFVVGGPQTDFNFLFESMKFWNVATLKLETTQSNLRSLNSLLNLLEKLKKQLHEETH